MPDPAPHLRLFGHVRKIAFGAADSRQTFSAPTDCTRAEFELEMDTRVMARAHEQHMDMTVHEQHMISS